MALWTALVCRSLVGLQGAPATQGYLQEHQTALSANPAGLTLHISFRDGRERFHLGEVIAVELSFSSQSVDRYEFSRRSSDRSGRLNMEEFHLWPSSTVNDPLQELFRFGYVGGGPDSLLKLGHEAQIVTLELNEWIQFEAAGKYRLYVNSRDRLRDLEKPDEPLELVSNLIEFEMLPRDADRDQRDFTRAILVLDSNKSSEEAKRRACRILRFLGTRQAAQAMANRLRPDAGRCGLEYYFGLITTGYRPFVLAQLERRLVDPNFPVSSRFLDALAFVRYLSERTSEDESRHPIGQLYEIRQRALNAARTRYLIVLAQAIAGKGDEAKAVSLATMIERADLLVEGKGSEPFAEAVQALPQVLEQLPADKQSFLLRHFWQAGLNNEAMLPVLERIYRMGRRHEDFRLPDTALRRLFELDPVRGRQLILREIVSPQPRVGIDALGLLPDTTLPGLDDALAGNLLQSSQQGVEFETHALLVERYASGSIRARVQGLLEADLGNWACRPQAAMLAYLLRVAPRQGEALTRRALRMRQSTVCYLSLLSDVAALHSSEALNPLAFELLEQDDLAMAASAALFLSHHGPPTAEARLRNRLESWNQRWGSLLDQSAARPGEKQHASIRLAEALCRGLATGSSWITGPDKLEEIAPLCPRNLQVDIEVWANLWQPPMALTLSFSDRSAEFSLAQYRLLSLDQVVHKIAQFPAGTVFQWDADVPAFFAQQAESMLEKVRARTGKRIEIIP